MKKLSLLLFLGIGVVVCKGQTLTPEVISSSGEHFSASPGSLSWTLGEIITESDSNGGYWLTQGFHQTKFTVVSVEESPKNTFNVNVYPNPAIQFFNIEIESSNFSKDFQFVLYDINGRSIKQGKIKTRKTTVNLNGLANESYFLKIWSATENYHKIYQVLKLK